MTEVTVTLPYPPAGLSPNSRLHWRAKAKLTREYREWAWAAGMEAKHNTLCTMWPLSPPVEAHVTFYVPDRRKRDQDNLLAMLKPAWDGMVDAGLLVGDDSRVFSVASVSVTPVATYPPYKSCDECGEPRVVVVLKGAE